MAIDKVLADVAVDDFALALTWYERLLGRPADAAPMDGLAEWHLAEGGGIQVSDYADRAGSSNVTLVMSSLLTSSSLRWRRREYPSDRSKGRRGS